MNKTAILSFSIALAVTPWLRADVKLPAVISDHMVLQQDAEDPVWGWAAPGEEVTVSIAGQTQTAHADQDGKWTVKLSKLKVADEPQTLIIKGRNTITVNDVLVGEVWLGSGQSNMEFQVNRAQNFAAEKAAANFPKIRMFTTAHTPQRTPQVDCQGSWKISTPENVGAFSATAYFFGRELHQKLNVPVGLLHSSFGGTDIDAWIAEEVQAARPELKVALDQWANDDVTYDPAVAKATFDKQMEAWAKKAEDAKAAGKPEPVKPVLVPQPRTNQNYPANLYNGMIAPLIPYAFRGVLWYQGEADSYAKDKTALYQERLSLLISDWRARWGHEFPFAWVQLPNYDHPDLRPLIREAMLKTLALPKTGMAITIDIGMAKENHPVNKQEVGRRLSLWALGTVYGQKVPTTSGPLPAGHEIKGSEVVLSFSHTDGGLVAREGELQGFVIAGEDKAWKPATARIEGDKVIVSQAEVPHPVAVRYAWAGFPTCNLYNGAGLPASPFRTDDWP